jgi:phage-related protein
VFQNMQSKRRRRWRDYRTAGGTRPVADFVRSLTEEESAEVLGGMDDVARNGLAIARHVRGDIYEVRVSAASRAFRILFATEGGYGQILLSLVGFTKKTQRTPPREISLAEHRLADWRARGASQHSRTH